MIRLTRPLPVATVAVVVLALLPAISPASPIDAAPIITTPADTSAVV